MRQTYNHLLAVGQAVREEIETFEAELPGLEELIKKGAKKFAADLDCALNTMNEVGDDIDAICQAVTDTRSPASNEIGHCINNAGKFEVDTSDLHGAVVEYERSCKRLAELRAPRDESVSISERSQDRQGESE